jgi:hypothetical protein
MGFTPGVIYDNTAAGWSSFTPVIVEGWASQQGSGYNGTGTRFIYVAANGSDGNPGTAALPKATLDRTVGGCSLLRNGHPDWLMIRQGDTFTTGAGHDAIESAPAGPLAFFFGGQDNQNFMLLTSYDPATPQTPHPGTGNRPILQTANGTNGITGVGSFLAVVGLEFYAYQRDFQNVVNYVGDGSLVDCAGISPSVGSFQWLWIEDCYIHCYGGNCVSAQDGSGSTCDQQHIRRCIVTDSVNQGGAHSQGLNTEGCTNSSIEECLMDFNGWTPQRGGMNQFNRNMYLSWGSGFFSSEYPSITVRGNVTTNNASNDQIRCGGTWDNNYSESFSQGIVIFSPTGRVSNITNSVFFGQFTDGNVNLLPCVSTGVCGQGRLFQGSTNVTANILSSPSPLSVQTSPGGLNIPWGANGDSWSNNPIYNYNVGSGPLTDGDSPPGFTINNGYTGRGCPVSYTINSPGSGYTSGTIFKFYMNPTAVNPGDVYTDTVNNATFTMQDSTTFNACQYQSGVTDTACYAIGSGPPHASSGSLTLTFQAGARSSPSLTYTNVSRAFPGIDQQSTSGSGGGAAFLIEANLAGAIVSAIPYGNDPTQSPQSGAPIIADNYQANDTITPVAFGGGGGCVIRVQTIGAITVSGNQTYSGTWTGNPFGWIGSATRSSSTYMTFLGQSPATLNGFVALCKQQRKGNWNANYTAVALNNYIRAGFLLPAYPPSGNVVITTPTLPNGFVGVTYSQQITASGGTAPYSFAITAGALPNGLTLGANGVIYGAASAAGTFNFSVTAMDSASHSSAPQSYTVSPVINVVMNPSGAPTLFTANILGHQ